MAAAEDIYIARLEKQIEQLNKSYTSLEYILGFVLLTVDKEVVITDEVMETGIPEDLKIYIKHDDEALCWRTGLAEEEESG